MTSRSLSVLLSAALVAATFPFSTPANAQNVRGMQDLIGARGSSLDGALERRGYKFAKKEGAASMYWNASRSSCISALVSNGRVDSIQRASASNCGRERDSGNHLVGVAIGAAAAGLIAALTSHHHGQGHRNNNEQYNRQFQRGYDDGSNGSQYARHDSEAYHAGYMAGEAERNRNHHHSHGNRPGHSGGREVRIADIKGMDGVKAFDELRSRGFENVDSLTQGKTLYGIYYLRRTGQCVQTTQATDNNRILDIRDIQTHPKCR